MSFTYKLFEASISDMHMNNEQFRSHPSKSVGIASTLSVSFRWYWARQDFAMVYVD